MLPGTIEYQANIRFLEDGKMRRFESPVWAHTLVGGVQQAVKVLNSTHPEAVVVGFELIDKAREELTKPKLVFSSPKAPPKKPA